MYFENIAYSLEFNEEVNRAYCPFNTFLKFIWRALLDIYCLWNISFGLTWKVIKRVF
jgi:hypothetical protein